MDGLQLFAAIVGSLFTGGGVVAAFFKYRTDNRKLDVEQTDAQADRKRSDLELALEVVTKQRDDAIDRVAQFEERLIKTELEVQGLRFARDLDPFPSWIVALDGKYLYVNREFEKQFLEPVGRNYRSVIGETHASIWPENFVRVLHDLDAIARRVPDGRARARTAINLREGAREVTVHKFPIRVREAVVGFAGFITEIEVVPETPMRGTPDPGEWR